MRAMNNYIYYILSVGAIHAKWSNVDRRSSCAKDAAK